MHNHEPKNYNCPFCRMVNSGLNNDTDVVYETKNVFACLSLHHQEGSGPTVLVIPKNHVENLYDINNQLLNEISTTVKYLATEIRKLWNTKGITIWQHNEPSGSQDVWHFHMHIKSRLKDDNLYQSKPILTESDIRDTWAKQLRQHLATI